MSNAISGGASTSYGLSLAALGWSGPGGSSMWVPASGIGRRRCWRYSRHAPAWSAWSGSRMGPARDGALCAKTPPPDGHGNHRRRATAWYARMAPRKRAARGSGCACLLGTTRRRGSCRSGHACSRIRERKGRAVLTSPSRLVRAGVRAGPLCALARPQEQSVVGVEARICSSSVTSRS